MKTASQIPILIIVIGGFMVIILIGGLLSKPPSHNWSATYCTANNDCDYMSGDSAEKGCPPIKILVDNEARLKPGSCEQVR